MNEEIVEILKEVVDPELGLDIYTLGLIYDIKVDGKNVHIKMTFTSPTCPYAPQLLEEVKLGLQEKGYEEEIEIVFSPVWQPSEDVKIMLGLA